MRKGFCEGIKPVSVTGGAVCIRRGGLFETDIPRGKYFSRRISDAKSDFPRELYVYPSRKVAFRDGYPYNSREKSFFFLKCALKVTVFPRVAESRDFNYGSPVNKIIQKSRNFIYKIIILLITKILYKILEKYT